MTPRPALLSARALAIALLTLAVVWLLPTTVSAQETAPSTLQSSVEMVIRDQMAAFQRDDAATAFGYAAPNIQQMFQTPDRFIDMVRRGYMPVYRPGAVEFGPFREIDGAYQQIVDIVDLGGNGWRALYTLVTLPDGSLKIAACVLVERPLTGV
ncbi:MAG: DUF4864 domain-containing protein [Pseudomonadota bacterium]